MSVMVGVPVKGCAIWIGKFLAQVLATFKGVSRFVFIHGEGGDPTLMMIREWSENVSTPVEIYNEMPFNAVSSAEIAPVYWDFQEIMKRGDETHFLGIDSDIMKTPKTLVRLLKKQKKDIIAPYVWTENAKPKTFYDTNIFRYNGYRFHPFDPPNPGETFRLDSVGTCFMATREAFTETEILNPYPHRSFCNKAREKGFKVWADPRINVYHLNKSPFGIVPMPLEVLKNRPQDETAYIKRNETIVPYKIIPTDFINAYVWGRTE